MMNWIVLRCSQVRFEAVALRKQVSEHLGQQRLASIFPRSMVTSARIAIEVIQTRSSDSTGIT
ncbi:hypothetical protein RBSH_04301 [Rhodopirellula baltica SH28]|uniref:Uncharacterized protein n=1 Tax=Rhodopirellula baltica SH28 TaxID=993517 RepID=K5D1K3_RHOBT|nr:hypothetical protein RBSH_04301 [Rhodopirellula baltica SH28]